MIDDLTGDIGDVNYLEPISDQLVSFRGKILRILSLRT
jgi:hypothetical protein